jgi:hypothetical protein
MEQFARVVDREVEALNWAANAEILKKAVHGFG